MVRFSFIQTIRINCFFRLLRIVEKRESGGEKVQIKFLASQLKQANLLAQGELALRVASMPDFYQEMNPHPGVLWGQLP